MPFRASHRKSHLRRLSGLVCLGAFFLVIVGLRWGTYLQTPLPKLMITDALLVIAGILGLTSLTRETVAAFARWFGLSAVLLTLGLGFAAMSIAQSPQVNLYLVVRDIAPYLYFSLIPALAIGLTSVKPNEFMGVVRWGCLANLTLATVAQVGLVAPFSSSLIANPTVQILSYRFDLQGVIYGVGLIAWGNWRPICRQRLVIQVLFVVGGVFLQSRAAVITFLCLALVALVRAWRRSEKRAVAAIVAAGLGALLAPIVIQNVADSWEHPQPSTRESLEQRQGELSESIFKTLPEGARKFAPSEFESIATAQARLTVYGQVFDWLRQDFHWIRGAGPGTDILYEICTGNPVAPPSIKVMRGESLVYLPKCAVDDANAATPLRDPHNWLLNLLMYFGLVGTLVLMAPMLVFYRCRRRSLVSLAVFIVAGFLICGLFGVVLSGPYALVPITVCLSWAVAACRRPDGIVALSTNLGETSPIK